MPNLTPSRRLSFFKGLRVRGIASLGLTLAAVACSSESTDGEARRDEPIVAAAAGAETPTLEPIPAPLPELTSAPDARIDASSVHERFDASGLLIAKEPGWHSSVPPAYPQVITVTFAKPQPLTRIALLPQNGLRVRAPRQVDVETSTDGRAWERITTIPNVCDGLENQWREFPLPQARTTTHARIVIQSNCGDPNYVTLRGLRFE